MTTTATDTHTDEEWADLLTDILHGLEPLAGKFPADNPMRMFVDDAFESLGGLLGYFATGDEPVG